VPVASNASGAVLKQSNIIINKGTQEDVWLTIAQLEAEQAKLEFPATAELARLRKEEILSEKESEVLADLKEMQRASTRRASVVKTIED
jgi:hypothetical protein